MEDKKLSLKIQENLALQSALEKLKKVLDKKGQHSDKPKNEQMNNLKTK